MKTWQKKLSDFLIGEVEFDKPARDFTTYQIGGRVDAFASPGDITDLMKLLDFVQTENLPYYVIGAGSNVLVSDEGFRGIFISLMKHFDYLKIAGDEVVAGAGLLVMKLIEECEKRGLAGIERLYGIPGTIGGGIKMNIRAYECEIGDYVKTVRIVREGRVEDLLRSQLGFRYRSSNIRDQDVIVDATIQLRKGLPDEIREIRERILNLRQKKQPLDWGSCGSTFKNPPGGKSAGELIEEAELKGTTIGDARISEIHANFFVNLGNASARDVIELMKMARKKVYQNSGIILEPEVKLVGFREDVLN